MALRPLVVGVGNELRGDDAIGLRLLERLQQTQLGDEVDFLALDGDLSEIEGEPRGRSRLAVIDALPPGNRPGRVTSWRIDPRDPPGGERFSLHDLDLLWQLGTLVARKGTEILLIGVEAKSLSFARELTPELHSRLPRIAARVEQEIRAFRNADQE